MRYLAIIFLCWPLFTRAQKLENLKAEMLGDKIIITYDIIQGYPGDKYTISLFSSHNNFSNPLTKVTGDVGEGIVEGRGKKIIWESKAELGEFKGKVDFDVRMTIVAPLSLTKQIHSVRRGKSVPIFWRGGSQASDVKVELLEYGTPSAELGNTTNSGKFEFNIPVKQKVGKEYRLRLTNGDETALTEPFAIKRKVPWLIKLTPVAGVAVLLAIAKGGGTSGDNKLSGPPDLGLN